MNKFALVTLAALPGQGSGVASYRAPEVWKAPEEKVEVQLVFGPDEGDEEDQSEGPPSDDPYFEVKAAFAKFGREAIEVRFGKGNGWKTWNALKEPAYSSPPECYRVAEKYRENI